MIEQILRDSFDGQIIKIFKEKQPDVCNFLLNHERKNLCINNMVELCAKTERLYPLKKEDIQYVGKSYADTFSKVALQYEEQQAVSDLERSRRIKKHEDQEAFSKQFNEGTLFSENTRVDEL